MTDFKNNTAEALAVATRAHFGSDMQPIELFAACDNAIRELEAFSCRYNNLHKANGRSSERKRKAMLALKAELAELEGKLAYEKRKTSVLQSKLTVANHKCSAYKSILKDAING